MLRKVGAPGVEVGLDLREIAHIALAEKGIGVKLKGNAEVRHDLLGVADVDGVKGQAMLGADLVDTDELVSGQSKLNGSGRHSTS